MQGIDADNDAPRITVESQSGTSLPSDRTVQRAAEHASEVARALSQAGYEPRHLSVTYSETGDLVLVARLDRRAPTPGRGTTIARLAIGVGLGLVLGFFGLPRLDLPGLSQPQEAPVPTPAVVSQVVPVVIPTQPPPQPTPSVVPTPAPLLHVGPFTAPLQGWPNDPKGTAWFANGVYHLYAREPGNFVATGLPFTTGQPVHDIRLSAQFHKLGGPAGGGYGLIVRDQSPPAE